MARSKEATDFDEVDEAELGECANSMVDLVFKGAIEVGGGWASGGGKNS